MCIICPSPPSPPHPHPSHRKLLVLRLTNTIGRQTHRQRKRKRDRQTGREGDTERETDKQRDRDRETYLPFACITNNILSLESLYLFKCCSFEFILREREKMTPKKS